MYLLFLVPTYMENGLRPLKRIPDKIGLYLFASWSLWMVEHVIYCFGVSRMVIIIISNTIVIIILSHSYYYYIVSTQYSLTHYSVPSGENCSDTARRDRSSAF